MYSLNDKEMYEVNGGATLGYSWINAITKAATFIYKIGQAVGSTVRRMQTGNLC